MAEHAPQPQTQPATPKPARQPKDKAAKSLGTRIVRVKSHRRKGKRRVWMKRRVKIRSAAPAAAPKAAKS